MPTGSSTFERVDRIAQVDGGGEGGERVIEEVEVFENEQGAEVNSKTSSEKQPAAALIPGRAHRAGGEVIDAGREHDQHDVDAAAEGVEEVARSQQHDPAVAVGGQEVERHEGGEEDDELR